MKRGINQFKKLMKPIMIFFFSLVLLSVSNSVCAQKGKIKKAESYFSKMRYYDASLIYIDLIERNQISASEYPDVYRNGAISLIKTKNYEKAKNALEFLSGTDQFTFDDASRYIHLMMFLNKQDDAKSMYQHKVVTESNDERKKSFDKYFNTAFLEDLKKDSLSYKLEKTVFNSDLGDFSPAYHPKGIAFTSARKETMSSAWSVENTAFLVQYLYDKKTGEVTKLKGVKGKKHDGVAFYDSIAHNWYYSKNIKKSRKIAMTTVGIYIYSEDTKSEQAFPFNEKNTFVAHPSLSADGNCLWFCSNREGGQGGLDIWSSINVDGVWQDPVNAGPMINSEMDEMFPFERNKVLYFASSGHEGLGGLDIFSANLDGINAIQVKNEGYPLNSHGDDFSLILDSSSITGYVSSNRGDFIDRIYSVKHENVMIELQASLKSGISNDPIASARVIVTNKEGLVIDTIYTDADGNFSFKGKPGDYALKVESPEFDGIDIPLEWASKTESEVVTSSYTMAPNKVSVSQKIIDKSTLAAVPGARVEFRDPSTGNVIEVFADENGDIHVDLPVGKEYQVTTYKEGYDPTVSKVSTKGSSREIKGVIEIGKTSSKVGIKLADILYEFGKATLSGEGTGELDTLSSFLKENPLVSVVISSHTDSRGSNAFNMALSARRSMSCLNHLVSKGVKRSMVLTKNFGETQLLNQCKDGVECSEELHEVNRRTEFVLVFPKENEAPLTK